MSITIVYSATGANCIIFRYSDSIIYGHSNPPASLHPLATRGRCGAAHFRRVVISEVGTFKDTQTYKLTDNSKADLFLPDGEENSCK